MNESEIAKSKKTIQHLLLMEVKPAHEKYNKIVFMTIEKFLLSCITIGRSL
jgi:hypothetical protein